MSVHTQDSKHSRGNTVSSYLGSDHDRLDAILGEVSRMVADGELERADHTYQEFFDGLHRHIRLEEQILFPLFEERTGMTQGPTQVMRHEHQTIQRALDVMRHSLAEQRADGFKEGLALLMQVLPDHNVKEERILYPMIDQALGDAERAELVGRLQRD